MSRTDDLKPRWMREVERLSAYRAQLFLYGNIKDTVLYPVGADGGAWTLGSMREALFELFRHQIGPYDVIAAFNPVDGMVFADLRDVNEMARLFAELVAKGEKEEVKPQGGRAVQPTRPSDPLELAIQQMRLCLANRDYPCVFILEHASQLLTSPINLQPSERTSFLRLLRASGESQVVAVGEGSARRPVQNLLVLLCDKLTDLPPWLYLNNPFCGSIEAELPHGLERRHFFDRFLGQDSPFEKDDLTDLTDGMSMRDLCGIRALARREGAHAANAKGLVDSYKYGVSVSEWDNLAWDRLQHAEEELSRRVIGQPAAVSAVADMLRRARLHLSGAQHSSHTKPRGVLFFAGPTGTGKTELAKATAELVFGSDEACVRFDMSEYGQAHADQRLFGAPPGYVGYEEGGQLCNKVKANPFCVLLFDEIEKAHPTILDKFLQILEDGRMTDGRGETVYFAESVIIFTSNVGIYQLDPATGRPMVNPATGQPLMHVDPSAEIEYEDLRQRLTDGVHRYFKHVLGRPELLNRIGQNVIVFDFVRPAVMRQILERKVLRSIAQQVFERWQMRVEFAPVVVDQLMAVMAKDLSSGGRGVGNLAEHAIVNPLARAMFQLLGEGKDLATLAMLVTGVELPLESGNDHRYDIAWVTREVEAPAREAEAHAPA